MTITNKIPAFNSLVDLKSFHNSMIDNKSKHGYYNLIANNRLDNIISVPTPGGDPGDTTDNIIYWNDSATNIRKSFVYSRTMSESEQNQLSAGNKIIFGLTYHDSSLSTTGSLVPSSVVVGGSGSIIFTQVQNSTVTQTVNNKEVITTFYEGVIGSVSSYTISFTLTYSGTTCKLLNCALFQGWDTSSYNSLETVDKFSQNVKYENETWMIRTGGTSFVELTTDHENETSGIHGVGAGDIVGTTLNQTLTNKIIDGCTFNNNYNSNSTGIVKVPPTTISDASWGNGWDSIGKIPDANVVKTAIKLIAANADVDAHAALTNNAHGINTAVGTSDASQNAIVGKYNTQTIENKTIYEPKLTGVHLKIPNGSFGNLSGSEWDFTKINQPITSSSTSGSITTDLNVVNYLKSLFAPSYYNHCTNFISTTLNNGTQGLLLRTNSIIDNMTADNIKFLSEVSLTNKQINSASISQPESVVVLKILSKGIYNIIFSGSCVTSESDAQVRIALTLDIFKTIQSDINTLNILDTDKISTGYNQRYTESSYNSDESSSVSVTCSAVVKVDLDNTWIAFRQIGANVQSNQFNVVINRTSPLL